MKSRRELMFGAAGLVTLLMATSARAQTMTVSASPDYLEGDGWAVTAVTTAIVSGGTPVTAPETTFPLEDRKSVLELAATVDFSQESGRRHKDVWEHTKQVVWQAERRPAVRWAALLHDIGKVKTRSITPDGKVCFHRHSEVGARLFEDVSRRLGFDGPTRRTLRFLILHHLRPNQYVESWTDSAVRRFAHEMGPVLTDLLGVRASLGLCRGPHDLFGRRIHDFVGLSVSCTDEISVDEHLLISDVHVLLLLCDVGRDLRLSCGCPCRRRPRNSKAFRPCPTRR